MRPANGRTLAQAYCLLAGLVVLLAGAFGFISDASFGGAHDGRGDFLGFTVNGWHNVLHIVTGLFLLAMRGEAARARAGALAFGVFYAVVAVWGFITGDSVFGIVAIDDAANWVHAGLAALAILSALASPSASYEDPDATRTRLTIYDPA
jgi:hypothetical protein